MSAYPHLSMSGRDPAYLQSTPDIAPELPSEPAPEPPEPPPQQFWNLEPAPEPSKLLSEPPDLFTCSESACSKLLQSLYYGDS